MRFEAASSRAHPTLRYHMEVSEQCLKTTKDGEVMHRLRFCRSRFAHEGLKLKR
jgi:hypothetical protein